jgi:uncharacterized membrane protein YeiB
MKQRIIGFDLARAYAIFGMYIVNFNIVFGNYSDTSWLGKFLALFSGNSSTVFVMLAGMGIALMTNRPMYTSEERANIQGTINKRAWFLFIIGMMLYLWWPADILHFYGAYLHIASLLLFVDKRYYLVVAGAAIVIFHGLLIAIPYETGWNFTTLEYKDFWTAVGFLRNTLYNGWNSVFPWLAYFTVGMFLGRLDWRERNTQRTMFGLGLTLYLSNLSLQILANTIPLNDDIKFYINADYLPPFLPFMIGTLGFGLMLIASFMFVGTYLQDRKFATYLAKTGQMTLTHYISHLTIGMMLFALITGRHYEAKLNNSTPVEPLYILLFSTVYFVVSIIFSYVWSRRFGNGPFETLMRKISG